MFFFDRANPYDLRIITSRSQSRGKLVVYTCQNHLNTFVHIYFRSFHNSKHKILFKDKIGCWKSRILSDELSKIGSGKDSLNAYVNGRPPSENQLKIEE